MSHLQQIEVPKGVITTLVKAPGKINGMNCILCNRTAEPITIRLSHIRDGDKSDDFCQYLYYGKEISPLSTEVVSLPISMSINDQLNIYADSEGLSANLYSFS